MSQNGQTHFKNLGTIATRFCLSDHFGALCIKGWRTYTGWNLIYQKKKKERKKETQMIVFIVKIQ